MKLISKERLSVPSDFFKLVLLALAAAAGAATVASLLDKLSENRFHRKVLSCMETIQSTLPTLRHAAELYIAEREPQDDKQDVIHF